MSSYVGRHREGVAPGTAAQRLRAAVEARRRELLAPLVPRARQWVALIRAVRPAVEAVEQPEGFTRTVVDLYALRAA